MGSTLDADIAAFLAEGNKPDEPLVETPPDAVAEADTGEADAETDDPAPAALADSDADNSDPEGDAEGDSEAPPAVADAALQKAIEAGDPIAFVKALGPNAEKLLGSKAHIALRLAVKDADKRITEASTQTAKAQELAEALGKKYSDPIAARKAAETGNPDAFIDMVERWSGGHPWNDIMKWVSSCLAGRPARLEAKQRQETGASADAQARQEQKQAEVRAWVDGGVKKLAPELHDPDVVDLVVAEIRAGYSKGINTPAKALPLVRKKLEERYQRLHKVFGKGASAKPKKGASPAAAAAHTDGGRVGRRTTLEEDIDWAKKHA